MELFAPGTVLATRYRILSELGRGGMGVVYLVEHVHTGQELALKVLSFGSSLTPSAIERFKREARAPARIKSDNVVNVTDADVLPELGGMPFFVMERLRGRDLEAEVVERGRFTAREVIDLLSQAARALDRSHALGLIHRDLKPENLFLHVRDDGSTCLKVLDFGISKMVDDEDGVKAASLTGPGSLLGTPLYMSPEQGSSGAAVTRATDVWSLGLVTVRLLTADYYWRASSLPELMASLLRDPLYAPTSRWGWLPPAFDAWFARACSRDPEQRFASVGEQVEQLGRALGAPAQALTAGSSVSVATDGPTPRAASVSPSALSIDPAATLLADSTKRSLVLTPSVTAPPHARRRTRALLGGAALMAIGAVAVVGPRLLTPQASAPGAPLVARSDDRPPPAVSDAPSVVSTAASDVPLAPSAVPSASASAARPAPTHNRAAPPSRGRVASPRVDPTTGSTHDPVAP